MLFGWFFIYNMPTAANPFNTPPYGPQPQPSENGFGQYVYYGPPTYDQYQARQPRQGDVLGDSTGPDNSSGGSLPTGSSIPNSNPQPQTAQIQTPDIDLSELYRPALDAANESERLVREGAQSDLTSLDARISQARDQYNTQQTQLIDDTNSEQTKFNKTLRSALGEAIQSYNALQQQGRARFGGYSSAGQAIGELARQEFFKQQGNINQKGVEGTEEFAKERGRIKSFIAQKNSDLDIYKEEAIREIQGNLKTQLATISARRGEIESNKTRDKLALLQDAQNQVRAIQDEDRRLRQEIAANSIMQMQQISGRAFSPNEIKAYMEEFAFGIPTSIAPAQGTNLNPAIAYNRYANGNTSEEDYLNTLGIRG